MKKLIANIKIILSPSYWVMNYPYSKEVDLFMIDLLDNYDFENIQQHTACLGGVKIWIENIPYACMWIYQGDCNILNLRPSRKTVYRGVKKLEQAKKNNTKQILLDLIKNKK